ncbi:MAG: AtpZ/AtpI family protein [Alphaproteobacteria bacterium]|nr:AtpZ/AtpI family protein [Alphaproteobacteria bacterium]
MSERNREPEDTERGGASPREGSPLADLKARLANARARDRKRAGGGKPADQSGVGIAVRVGIELAGTLAVGVGIGWLLDRWLGTGPWLLVVFFFLGGAAGVLNVYRAVKNIGLAPGYPKGDGAEDGNKPGG